MKKNRNIIILIIIIILAFIGTLGLINKNKIIKTFEDKIQNQSQNQNQTLLSYEIYNNEDNNNLKILLTINSEKGIEYVKNPNGTVIYGYGKTRISIDYTYCLGNEDIFEIKEIGQKESKEKILISESGNAETPFYIMNAEQLLNIQNISDGILLNIPKNKIYYRLGADIDLSDVEWKPIGSQSNPFISTLDGNGYTIYNLNYENGEEDNVGLFKYVSGTLKNIKLDNAIITGKNNVGGLVGYSTGTLTGNEINATVNGVSNVGGLVGKSDNIITNNIANGEVIATGDNVGGLVGNTLGNVTENVSNVNVIGVNCTGGLIGLYSNKGTADDEIKINYNETTGDVRGTDNVGGIIGKVYRVKGKIYLESNKSKGNVDGWTCIGGILGYLELGDVYNSITYGYVQNSYATGNISALGNYVGGLIGFQYVGGGGSGGASYFYLENSYSTGSVNSAGNSTGGLIGKSDTQGTGSQYDGLGRTYINNCFSTSNVSGNKNVGGIIGELVRRPGSSRGYSYIDIVNVYTTGKILGQSNFEPLFGCYTETRTKKGTLTISNVYWILETTGLETSTYGTMKNLNNMFNANQFPTFDFSSIWNIDEGISMPYLRNLDKPDAVNKENISY